MLKVFLRISVYSRITNKLNFMFFSILTQVPFVIVTRGRVESEIKRNVFVSTVVTVTNSATHLLCAKQKKIVKLCGIFHVLVNEFN